MNPMQASWCAWCGKDQALADQVVCQGCFEQAIPGTNPGPSMSDGLAEDAPGRILDDAEGCLFLDARTHCGYWVRQNRLSGGETILTGDRGVEPHAGEGGATMEAWGMALVGRRFLVAQHGFDSSGGRLWDAIVYRDADLPLIRAELEAMQNNRMVDAPTCEQYVARAKAEAKPHAGAGGGSHAQSSGQSVALCADHGGGQNRP